MLHLPCQALLQLLALFGFLETLITSFPTINPLYLCIAFIHRLWLCHLSGEGGCGVPIAVGEALL